MADWPSDKELEEIYRIGSEGHDFQYTQDAWSEMEHLLDKRKRRKFILMAFSILFLASLTYIAKPYLISDNSSLNQTELVSSHGETSTNISEVSSTNTQNVIVKL